MSDVATRTGYTQREGALVRFWTRILCDTLPPRADIIYMVCEHRDNEESVFPAVANLYHQKNSLRVGICDGETDHGYPGFTHWEEKLIDLGIPKEHIEQIWMPRDIGVNTRSEAIRFIEFVRSQGIHSCILVAWPAHLPRTFLTFGKTAEGLNVSSLKLYAYPGKALPWDETVMHSQGLVKDTREEIIENEELSRIWRYHREGHLWSPEEGLEYLQKRESIPTAVD